MKHTHNKQRVGIIFGGESAEHEVSIASAQNVIAAIDTVHFEAVPIYVTKQGAWLASTPEALPKAEPPKHSVQLDLLKNIDIVFPLIHGSRGEDGSLQGLLELLALPYVGCNIVSSASAMDKEVSKRLLRDAGLAVTDFVVVRAAQTVDADAILSQLGLPVFVKPANAGSSLGISKVTHKNDLRKATTHALGFDNKILIERAVHGSEVECAVLGNANPKVSVPGRIAVANGFYDYTAKYTEGLATLEVPARLSAKMNQAVQQTALKAFTALGCTGMARVDMFITSNNTIIVNEINTIPGFTKFSMYPKLWQASGLLYTELITKLLHLAVERFKDRI
ncbi:MAG TPA: D-alanine--D-alanine ligase family protein [Candidatus Saccharimonadales bacterium]|nr:D-alanine--D-alanine ligase family protein [Candidatus Saccharimonadales bacterium]